MMLFLYLLAAAVSANPVNKPPSASSAAAEYVKAFCDEALGTPLGGITCSRIIAQINTNDVAKGQAQVQRRFCFEGYVACKKSKNVLDNCNNGLSRCMVGSWACNAGGASHTTQNTASFFPKASPSPPTSIAVTTFKKHCKDDSVGGVGCNTMFGMVDTNDMSRSQANAQVAADGSKGFCYVAYAKCHKLLAEGANGAWDNCNNSLSRCMSGSWNCNAYGPTPGHSAPVIPSEGSGSEGSGSYSGE